MCRILLRICLLCRRKIWSCLLVLMGVICIVGNRKMTSKLKGGIKLAGGIYWTLLSLSLCRARSRFRCRSMLVSAFSLAFSSRISFCLFIAALMDRNAIIELGIWRLALFWVKIHNNNIAPPFIFNYYYNYRYL